MNSKPKWPKSKLVKFPMLSNRPAFALTAGLEKQDRNWRNLLVDQIVKDNRENSDGVETPIKLIRDHLDGVIHRQYHVARLVQVYFENQTHGNYSDPFLESLFIILTWRGRISFAQNIINELQQEFSSPIDILEPRAFDAVKRIVGRAGFSEKRPEMVVELVRLFFFSIPKREF